MGPDAESMHDSSRFAENNEEDTLETAMSKSDSYFVSKRNLVHEGSFQQTVSVARESVEAFVWKLFELAQHCEFLNRRNVFETVRS